MSDAGSPADVVIVGGGMVGASLALALARTRWRVVLIEALAPGSEAGAHPSFDERTTAIGNGSRAILEALDVWAGLAARSAPIAELRISQAGRFGRARISARELGIEALGYALSNDDLGAALWGALRARPFGGERVALRAPARVSALDVQADALALTVQGQGGPERLLARLVVAADGSDSLVKRVMGIGTRQRAYDQVALVATVRTDAPSTAIAYERFTPAGPIAVLPRPDGTYTTVWTCSPERASALGALDSTALAATWQEAFGWQVGRVSAIGRPSAYPLALATAASLIGTRTVVIGNAAQRLHPVAAQGFNLGLRDAALLAEALADPALVDPGAPLLLSAYAQQRTDDRRGMVGFTDGLVRLFDADWPLLGTARGLGLALFDVCPPAKRALSSLSWGFGRHRPRLARALGLVPGEANAPRA